MRFFHSLLVATLVLAAQSSSVERPKCISQPWQMLNLTIFTANPSSDTDSFLHFFFKDPNFNDSNFTDPIFVVSRVPAECVLSVEIVNDPNHDWLLDAGWISCHGGETGPVLNGAMFQYTRDGMLLMRTGVEYQVASDIQQTRGKKANCTVETITLFWEFH